MTSDLDPMLPCPVRKRGEHDLSVIVPSEDTGDLTLFCDACGAVRRLPVSGALQLDDRAADEILRAAWRP